MNEFFPRLIQIIYTPVYGGTLGSVVVLLVCSVIFFLTMAIHWRKDRIGRFISFTIMTSSMGSIIGTLTGWYTTADFFQIIMYIGVAAMLLVLWRSGEITTERRRNTR